MRAIFISYRRDDSEGQAGRLYDDLIRQFGERSVFMDVTAIEPGFDFRKVIDESVSSCGVLLALIGPAWLDAKDESGRRRLDDALDFVRLETAAALKRDIPVVPVLVAKARMPRAEQLPDDLKELAYRNGVELSHARWDADIQLLVKALQRHMGNLPSEGASVRAKGDRAQGLVANGTAPADAQGAGSLRPDQRRTATKSWRTVALAGMAAAAIAAGVWYASYESRKASRDEEFKVRQAAPDASNRQLTEDQKRTEDERAVRAAATNPDAAPQTVAERGAANRSTVEPPSQASIPKFRRHLGTDRRELQGRTSIGWRGCRAPHDYSAGVARKDPDARVADYQRGHGDLSDVPCARRPKLAPRSERSRGGAGRYVYVEAGGFGSGLGNNVPLQSAFS